MEAFTKDPDANLDYTQDWSAYLAEGDTISSSEWFVADTAATDETPVEVGIDSYTDTETLVWLSGGTTGTTYIVTNRVTTTGGRIDDRSIKIKVKEQ